MKPYSVCTVCGGAKGPKHECVVDVGGDMMLIEAARPLTVHDFGRIVGRPPSASEIARNNLLPTGGVFQPGAGTALPIDSSPYALTRRDDYMYDETPKRVLREFSPDPDLVGFIEQLLDRAKSGKLTGIAVATVEHDDLIPAGQVDHGWCLSGGVGWGLDRAIGRLKHFWDKHTHEG